MSDLDVSGGQEVAGTRREAIVRVRDLVAARDWLARHATLDGALFALALGLFLATRLYRLEDFPIYFFTDEAVQTVLAADFVRDNFHDSAGKLFPTYFQNAASFNLSLSVYAQIIPYELFGHSIFVTRATSVLIALTGMGAVGLILRDAFKLRFWWSGVLLLSIMPAWFLHSRTAFETVLFVAFFAWFLYFYLRYRLDRPIFLFPALLFGAMTFYSYNGSQMAIVVTAAALALSDVRYHVRHWPYAVGGIAMLAVMALPYLRFRHDHPDEVYLHLRALDSYWLNDDLSVRDKVNMFWDEYTFGLKPGYWFVADNSRDLIRHQMKGYGQILLATLPLALLGVVVCARNVASPAHRAVLIAAAAAPTGGAMVAVAVTRVLVFVVPVALLTAIGLAAVLGPLTTRVSYARMAVALFAVLAVVNVAMMRDALENGPTWYHDYHLGGLQWGGPQIADAVSEELARSPTTTAVITPTWANGTDTIFRFLLDDHPRFRMGSIDGYQQNKLALSRDELFVMTAEEHKRLVQDAKFSDIKVERQLRYPDGSEGFYFVRFSYSPSADAIFAEEIAERRKPVEEDVEVNGETVATLHSRFGAGRIQDLFDDDTYTLVRTMEANPVVVELTYPTPREISSLRLTIGTHDVDVTVRLYEEGATEPVSYTQRFAGLGADPTLDMRFEGAPSLVSKVRLEVLDIKQGEFAMVHVREVDLRGGG